MVSKPRGAPGCLPASIPWFVIFFTIIVAIAAILALVGWPNIDNVTCLLTLSVALQESQYQAMTGPLQGSRRCKTHHCHRHNNTQFHCLHYSPCRRCQKWKNLMVNDTQECNKGQIGEVYIFFAYTMHWGRAENPYGGFPLQVWVSRPFTISIIPLVNNAKNRRPLRRSSSANATGITQRVVCKIFTHATRDSGAENLVDQMGRNVGLPLTMVGSGLRVPGNCNIWQHWWTKPGKTTGQHLCGTFRPCVPPSTTNFWTNRGGLMTTELMHPHGIGCIVRHHLP